MTVRAAITDTVKRGLKRAGYYALRLSRDRFPGVLVLCYHGVRADHAAPDRRAFPGLHVSEEELDAHCRALRETCHPISLEQWRQSRSGGPALPERPVLMTFDDGYRSVLTLGEPILARWHMPAVVFVSSDAVANQRIFWHDAMARARGESAVNALKAEPAAAQCAAAAVHAMDASESDPLAPMRPEDVRTLADRGVEIGGHTRAHVCLSRWSLPDQRLEIAEDKARIESWVGRPIRTFAYPNGRPSIDFTDETSRLVGELGYDFAFSTQGAFATPNESPLCLSRYMMLAGISGAELLHRLTHSWR